MVVRSASIYNYHNDNRTLLSQSSDRETSANHWWTYLYPWLNIFNSGSMSEECRATHPINELIVSVLCQLFLLFLCVLCRASTERHVKVEHFPVVLLTASNKNKSLVKNWCTIERKFAVCVYVYIYKYIYGRTHKTIIQYHQESERREQRIHAIISFSLFYKKTSVCRYTYCRR